MDITELGDPTVARPSKLADPLYYSSVRALAAAIQSGRVSSLEVVDAMTRASLCCERV